MGPRLRCLYVAVLRHLVLGWLALAIAVASGGQVGRAGRCTFQLGFAAIHRAVPDVVADCLSDEWHDASTGDGLQPTTRGLLVWRKLDNRAAFTDGYRTWVNGPLGLQTRRNSERFAWEADDRSVQVKVFFRTNRSRWRTLVSCCRYFVPSPR